MSKESEKLICPICKKEISRGNKILAFDEFRPVDYEWDDYDEYGFFDEVIPVHGQWYLAHYYCIFKEVKI